MIYISPTSGKIQGAFAARSLRGGKSRLKAVSLEVMSKSSEWLAVTHRGWQGVCFKFLF